MTNFFLETLLYDVFREQGAVDARGLAHQAAEALAHDRRNAQIFALRATMTEELISMRFGISVRQVRRIIKAQYQIRRAAHQTGTSACPVIELNMGAETPPNVGLFAVKRSDDPRRG